MGILDQLTGGNMAWRPPAEPFAVTGGQQAAAAVPQVLGNQARGILDTLMAPADVMEGRASVNDPRTLDRMIALGGMMSSPFGAGDPAVAGMGMRAYHGSPVNDLKAFDLSKLGTGEGNLFQGKGFYFSESPNVADLYRETPNSAGPGTRYTVDIAPDPQHFVNYDIPLSDQPQHIRQTIDGYLDQIDPGAKRYMRTHEPGFMGPYTLDSLHEALQSVGRGDEFWSTLQQSGVRGVRYADQGSVGQGAQNYVVFDPQDLTITHANDMPIRTGGGTPLYQLPTGSVVDPNGVPQT